MDSVPIAQFLESTYPDPTVTLTSELGREIETKARTVISKAFRTSVSPREPKILSPRSQEHFLRRIAPLGHRFEDLLAQEEQSWNAVGDAMREVGELMQTHTAEGPFVLGARPSATDFFIAGNLQTARVVDEGVFQRIVGYPGFKEIYSACLPYMEKKD